MKNFTIKNIRAALAEGSISSEQLVKTAISAFEKDNKSAQPLNAFLELYGDAAVLARSCDEERSSAAANGRAALETLLAKKPLLGIPFGVKDNISVKGKNLSCGSRILQGYTAPYNARVIQRLVDAGAIPLGRCNQDEFAMGSSTEYSAYGPARNPVNPNYVPGGSSGGSAAVVAAGLVPFSLGTETGGSVRLPAAYCGIYGLKPTYGALSRWGIVAFGSSLDQAGIFSLTPADMALVLSLMTGEDFYDDTVCALPDAENLQKFFCAASDAELSKLKIAIPRQFAELEGLDKEVESVFCEVKDWFAQKGASISLVDIPVLDASIACYYVIAVSEAASNLSRFDGIRYGARKDSGEGLDELYIKTRSEGFCEEVKRRIIIGNYVLSEQFSGNCYKKAMSVRARIQRELAVLYQSYDMILCPTSPTPAFKLGQKTDNPMAMYLSDMFTTFVNLSRTAALSVPAGFAKVEEENGTFSLLPVGIQFAGPMFSEGRLLSIAQAWENDKRQGGRE